MHLLICVSLGSIVMSPLLFLILVIWVFSNFSLVKLANFLFKFRRNNFWFCWFSLLSFLFSTWLISILIFIRSVLGVLWKEWCESWNSSTLVTSCEELTHWKRLWCWEGLRAGGEEDDRGWDGWMASLTRWTWVWVNSRSWWWTGRPGVLQFMGSQRVGHAWVTELNWIFIIFFLLHALVLLCSYVY